ncbi:hypothetical protein RJ639_001652 [Escallonia herrerae]|uniref:Exocyst complex component Sec8 n=1 Tax=Escallonia herrerae TaxID=1293975 RepID=A0AA89BIH0_9ASTE|nr:hypothetical protein RJ639_001652 [Escallonia herrerae]
MEFGMKREGINPRQEALINGLVSSSYDGHDDDGALDMHDEATLDGYAASVRVNGGDSNLKDVKIVSHVIPTWLSFSTPDEFVETMRKSDAPLHVNQRLRPTVHEIITTKIRAHADYVNTLRPGIGQATRTATTGLHFLKGQLESYQLPKQRRVNGISMSGTQLAVSPVSPVMAPMGTAQAAARELLHSILDTVVRIFGQMQA